MTPPEDTGRQDDDRHDFAGYLALVAELEAQAATLSARVADLERLNGSNSGKPPSSDG